MVADPIEPTGGVIHVAAPDFEAQLAAELGREGARLVPMGRLFHAPSGRAGAPRPAWAVNTWLDPVRVRFELRSPRGGDRV